MSRAEQEERGVVAGRKYLARPGGGNGNDGVRRSSWLAPGGDGGRNLVRRARGPRRGTPALIRAGRGVSLVFPGWGFCRAPLRLRAGDWMTGGTVGWGSVSVRRRWSRGRREGVILSRGGGPARRRGLELVTPPLAA